MVIYIYNLFVIYKIFLAKSRTIFNKSKKRRTTEGTEKKEMKGEKRKERTRRAGGGVVPDNI